MNIDQLKNQVASLNELLESIEKTENQSTKISLIEALGDSARVLSSDANRYARDLRYDLRDRAERQFRGGTYDDRGSDDRRGGRDERGGRHDSRRY